MRQVFIWTLPFFPMAVLSQSKSASASVQWGVEQSVADVGEFQRVIGEDLTGIYLVLNGDKQLIVQKLDRQLLPVFTKSLPLENGTRILTLVDIFVARDRIIAFARYFDKRKGSHTLLARSFDNVGMTPIGEWEQIDQYDSKEDIDGFYLAISPNKEHILEWHFASGSQFKLYNGRLELERIRRTEPLSRVMHVSDQGDVLFAAWMYLGGATGPYRAAVTDTAGWELHLCTYSGDDEVEDHLILFTHNVPTRILGSEMGDGMLVEDCSSAASSNIILGSGLFRKPGRRCCLGVYSLGIDPRAKELVTEDFQEFSDTLITEYLDEKEKKRVRREAEKNNGGDWMYPVEFQYRQIERRPDGGAVFVGERYQRECSGGSSSFASPSIMSNGGGGCSYHYDDLLVISIGRNGSIKWMTKILKRQTSKNDQGSFSSYAMGSNGSDLYFIYNDRRENTDLGPEEKFKPIDPKSENAIVMMVTLQDDGTVIREVLFDYQRGALVLQPKMCSRLQDGRLFLVATNGKACRFGTLTFQ